MAIQLSTQARRHRIRAGAAAFGLVVLGAPALLAGAPPAGADSGTTQATFTCVDGAHTTSGDASLVAAIEQNLSAALANPLPVNITYDLHNQGVGVFGTWSVSVSLGPLPSPGGGAQGTIALLPGGSASVNLTNTVQGSVTGPVPEVAAGPLFDRVISVAGSLSGGATPTGGAVTATPDAVIAPLSISVTWFVTGTVQTTLTCTPSGAPPTVGTTTPITTPCHAAHPAAAATFSDVPAGAWYRSGVDWLVASSIASGTTATTYSPEMTVTRGQMANFLWKYACSPAGAPVAPFTDATGQWFSAGVNWVADQGVATGTSATTYSPSNPVTRAQMAMFLWRLSGSPGGSPAASFSDVASNAWYKPGVDWLVANQVATGTSSTTYSPNNVVTRAQMANFLNRLDLNT